MYIYIQSTTTCTLFGVLFVVLKLVVLLLHISRTLPGLPKYITANIAEKP